MEEASLFVILFSILLSLLFAAFFNGIEIAFVTSNKLKIELDKKLGILPARLFSFFLHHQSKFLSTLLLANNAALVIYGIFMADLLEAPLYDFFQRFMGQGPADITVLLVQTIISTIVILIFAEFFPKMIFRINPNKKLGVFALPVVVICFPLFYLVWLFYLLADYFLRLFSIRITESELAFGKVDLNYYLKEATSQNVSEEEMDSEIQIFQNALDFSSIKARECMVPRNEIEALEMETDIEKLKTLFIETGYSKILIYKENIDNVIGYVHSFELFAKPESIKTILRPVAIIPETVTVDTVLETLIKQKKNVALVVDEYGGTAGMLTIEDIVEEIFGEIEDEHDHEDLIEEKTGENEYHFAARLEIDYLNEEYDLNLPESDDYETLAGLIIHLHEDLPGQGERIKIPPYEVEILKVSGQRIEEVRLALSQTND